MDNLVALEGVCRRKKKKCPIFFLMVEGTPPSLPFLKKMESCLLRRLYFIFKKAGD